jgi:hypothetical protein
MMPREPETPATVRAEAEARGRAAFEAATTEPPATAPAAWWESQGKGTTKKKER